MMELRKTCFLRDRVRSRHVAAGFVELTGQLIRDELDGRWWKTPPGSVSGNDEGDRHWCWLDLWQEIADDDKWDSIGIMTSDGRLQGAMIYRIDADSFMEPGKQAVYVDNLATAPWNRPTVTESCRYSGVGSELLLQAIHHSHLLLHDGRLNLATLPDSFGFYESHGFRDTGAIIEGLPVLELSAQNARKKLLDKGIIYEEDTPSF